MGDHITRYDRMPIPPIEANTQYFEAGPVRIGVEFRILDDATVAAIRGSLLSATGSDVGQLTELDDCGVSLHIFMGGQEHLRFDCFTEDPHYHYVGWARRSNEVLHLDPVADGDPLAWALERVRTRLPQMLERAGCPEHARAVDLAEIERMLPRITECAYRLRFQAEQTRAITAQAS
jgi:hypothetical protein